MSNILLHTCCGPCSTYTVEHLRKEGFSPAGFWYNPNIHPFSEHRLRQDSMRKFAENVSLPLIEEEGYEVIRYFREIAGIEGERCRTCYRLRLGRTAQRAAELNIPLITTTLLISPYQKHEQIKEVGDEVATAWGVEFYYGDFKAGYRESRRMAREMDLYRQKYCGCVFSEWERYGDVDVAVEAKKLESDLMGVERRGII
jgi:hypothetical protein